jgi:hypothetical protein
MATVTLTISDTDEHGGVSIAFDARPLYDTERQGRLTPAQRLAGKAIESAIQHVDEATGGKWRGTIKTSGISPETGIRQWEKICPLLRGRITPEAARKLGPLVVENGTATLRRAAKGGKGA